MKNRIFAIITALLVLLSSCDGSTELDNTNDSGTNFPSSFAETQSPERSLSDYTIVVKDNTEESVLDAAKELYTVLKDRYGNATLSDDYDGKADNSARAEILIGDTNRAESENAIAGCEEFDFAIRFEGDKLVIAAKHPDITAYAVRYFIKNCLGSDGVEPELSLLLSYSELVGLDSNYYDEVYNMNCTRPTEDIVYPESSGTGTLEKLDSKTVLKTDIYTGGPQFIAKLYTEAFSRSPSGAEYAAAAAVIAEDGCTPETLAFLAQNVFSSDEYANAGLTDRERCFTVYRAILSRDPTADELAEFDGNASISAASLIALPEFAGLMQGIIAGPYFWRGANEASYTGAEVILASELQTRLSQYSVTELPRGMLVIMDCELVLPAGATLKTEGEPSHYSMMARLLRTKENGTQHNLVRMEEESKLKSIFIDGNMQAFALDETAAGSNTAIVGSYCDLTYCRVSDSTSHQNVWAVGANSEVYIAHNLITGYASNHDKTWQDGISCLASASVIEYNDIVDTTDGAIAVFRYIENTPAFNYLRAQNSIIRYNNILNAGNSAYVAHDYETVNYFAIGKAPEHDANMTGLMSYENNIWTSWRAHYHMMTTFSTVPWQGEVVNDRAFGGSFYNNSSPEDCFVLCACGINVDKVDDAVIRGNNFTFYLGDWCRSDPRLCARAYSINKSNSSGDFQPGYLDMAMSTESATFIVNLISGLKLEAADKVELQSWRLSEDKVTIPITRFKAK